jgi:hypothetical protein
MFYPGRAFRVGTAWDTFTLIDRTIEDPYRLLWDQDATDDYNLSITTKNSKRMITRFTRSTQHQPATATDDDRQPDGLESTLQMKHDIVRYREAYNDRARIAVTVTDPATGQSITIRASTIGTSYRGARMHWGWKSTVRTDLPAMGDRYAP